MKFPFTGHNDGRNAIMVEGVAPWTEAPVHDCTYRKVLLLF
jgi:hypothetical protein